MARNLERESSRRLYGKHGDGLDYISSTQGMGTFLDGIKEALTPQGENSSLKDRARAILASRFVKKHLESSLGAKGSRDPEAVTFMGFLASKMAFEHRVVDDEVANTTALVHSLVDSDLTDEIVLFSTEGKDRKTDHRNREVIIKTLEGFGYGDETESTEIFMPEKGVTARTEAVPVGDTGAFLHLYEFETSYMHTDLELVFTPAGVPEPQI